MLCPKCGAANDPGSDTCGSCGLIFARYDPAALARQREERATARAESARARRGLFFAAGAVLVAVLAGLWWSGRTPPQAFVEPTGGGRVFAGLAHDYAGAGADLYLVNGGWTVQAVGRIEADGRFRFELPAALVLSRLTRTMQLQQKQMGEGPGAAQDRLREEIAGWIIQPQAAVHALYAGDAWTELTVEPQAMNVARYALAYGNDAEHGDLFVANAQMGVVALPGQAMLVLVYADRPGKVRGVVQTMNAFGAAVPHAWDLDLKAGWNLVTSEQNDDMATLRYHSGPRPEDLAWWTVAGR